MNFFCCSTNRNKYNIDVTHLCNQTLHCDRYLKSSHSLIKGHILGMNDTSFFVSFLTKSYLVSESFSKLMELQNKITSFFYELNVHELYISNQLKHSTPFFSWHTESCTGPNLFFMETDANSFPSIGRQ